MGMSGDLGAVGHHDDGRTRLAQALEQVQEACSGRGVEAAVGSSASRIFGSLAGPGDGYPLSFAPRQLRGQAASRPSRSTRPGADEPGPPSGGPIDVPSIGSSTLSRADSWGSRLWNWKTRPTSLASVGAQVADAGQIVSGHDDGPEVGMSMAARR